MGEACNLKAVPSNVAAGYGLRKLGFWSTAIICPRNASVAKVGTCDPDARATPSLGVPLPDEFLDDLLGIGQKGLGLDSVRNRPMERSVARIGAADVNLRDGAEICGAAPAGAGPSMPTRDHQIPWTLVAARSDLGILRPIPAFLPDGPAFI